MTAAVIGAHVGQAPPVGSTANGSATSSGAVPSGEGQKPGADTGIPLIDSVLHLLKGLLGG